MNIEPAASSSLSRNHLNFVTCQNSTDPLINREFSAQNPNILQNNFAAASPISSVIDLPHIRSNHGFIENSRMTKSCKLSLTISDRRLVQCVGKIEHKHQKCEQQNKSKKGMYNSIYQLKFGPVPPAVKLASKGFGKASRNHSFTSEAAFDHILVMLFKSDILDDADMSAICESHPLYRHLAVTMRRCRNINFSILRDDDVNYDAQVEVPVKKRMATLSAAIYFNMNIPAVIRYCGGTYTGAFRDVKKIISNLQGIVPTRLLQEIKRLYTVGAPRFFSGHSTKENFWMYKRYGNHASITKKPTLIEKALVKEDKHRFALPFPGWLARFIPNLHLTPEGLIVKPGKNDRIIFDASFKINWNSENVNMWSDPKLEPEIFYGTTFERHLTRIWNLRISYPNRDIFLWDDDIAGAFRLIKYNPEIATAFSANILGTLWIPTGQVFGSNTSP